MEKWRVVKQDMRQILKMEGEARFRTEDGAISLEEIFVQKQSKFRLSSSFLIIVLSGNISGSNGEKYGPSDCFSSDETEKYTCGDEICRMVAVSVSSCSVRFSLPDLYLNELSSFVAAGIRFSIGPFEGRKEGRLSLEGERVAVMVLQGAFEVNERLLETSDTLFGSTIDAIEFEALSNNALILVADYQFTV